MYTGPVLDLCWVQLSHQSGALIFKKKCSLETVINDIWLGGASKQNAPFLKTFAPKNAPMSLMSRIDPGIYKAIISAQHMYKCLICFLTINCKLNIEIG